MRSVIEYQDYRKFMQDFYDEKKRTSAFSWREFASRAGYTSPVFLKLVCEGKNGLPKKKIPIVGAAMDLAGYELDYFANLVVFNQGRRDADRKKAYENMKAIAADHKVTILGNDLYDYFSNWFNPIIRELAPTMPGASPYELAKSIIPDITSSQVENSLKFLVKAGLLRLKNDGRFAMAEKSISSGNPDISSLAIRNFHKEMGTLALDSIENIPVDQRNFSSLTLGLTRNAYEEILKELAEFRRRVVAIATKSTDMDQVYQMNFQLFPLTRTRNDNEEA